MKKQTAVEWLHDTWGNYPDLWSWEKIQEWFAQAKAMEKEQIIEAAQYEPWLGNMSRKTGENYYNEKYQNNNNP